MIKSEGLDSLTEDELRSACRARGMRAPFGERSGAFMKDQMREWLDLSLNRSVYPATSCSKPEAPLQARCSCACLWAQASHLALLWNDSSCLEHQDLSLNKSVHSATFCSKSEAPCVLSLCMSLAPNTLLDCESTSAVLSNKASI